MGCYERRRPSSQALVLYPGFSLAYQGSSRYGKENQDCGSETRCDFGGEKSIRFPYCGRRLIPRFKRRVTINEVA
ncbi:hypothetical protein MIMGU_mgv1a025541mg [Erythranthe guttata]|uniref:Uncharacterized protein n=1 Tax=Erythranthe guttata TaxID=4155 RepID=A0A022PYI4_ERYGU|nr:hypothetical protein MIMGU_mgv1a025541mg [Erythranthe guttata]